MIDQERSHKPPFSARCRDVAANAGAVDHTLPVVGQSEINQRLQERIPDALFGPAPEPDIDRVPLAVALVHVAPGTTSPQYVEHTIEKAPIIPGRPRPTPRSGGSSGPISSQSASDKSPGPITVPQKAFLNQNSRHRGIPFVNTA